MKYFLLLVFSALFINTITSAQGIWTELNGTGITQPASELPHNLGAASGFSAGGKAYFGTGEYSHGFSGFATNDFYSYDPSLNKWHSGTQLPASGREYCTAFELSGYGYIGLGKDDSNSFTDLWKYDHLSDIWTQQADFPAAPRSFSGSFCINYKGYVIGGVNSDTVPYIFYNDTWEYDPIANSWLQKSDFPLNGISNGAGFAVNFYGYLTCVFNSGSVHQTTYRYSQVNDTWDTVATFPANYTTLAFSLAGYGYVMDHSTLYQYDPVNDNWNTKTPAPFSVNTNFAVIMNNLAWLLFPFGDVYTYDPSNDSWNHDYTSPAFYQEPFGHAIVIGDTGYSGMWKYDFASDFWFVDSDFVNVNWYFSIGNVGYANRNGTLQSYDQSSNSWSTLPPVSLTFSLTSPVIYFPLNGKCYFGIGIDSVAPGGNSFYEYDPTTSSWTRKADFPGPCRWGASSFALYDNGYIAGGMDSSEQGLKEVWKYDPVTNSWSQKADAPDVCLYCLTVSNNNIAYYGFGSQDFQPTPDYQYFNAYDPISDSWGPDISRPVGGHGVIGFSKDNLIYLGHGAEYYSHPYSDQFYNFYKYDVNVGIDESIFPQVEIYPSISSEKIYIKTSSRISSITVFNSNGMEMDIPSGSVFNSEIDIRSLSPGIYFLKIGNDQSSLVKKFIRR